MKEGKSTELVRKGTFLLVISVVIKLIGLLYRIPLTNMLGNQGNGIYGLPFQIYSFIITLATMGVSTAISRMVSERMARGEKANARLVFRIGIIYAAVIGILVHVVLFFGADFIAGTIFNDISAAPAIRVLAPVTMMVLFSSIIRGTYQAVGDVRPSAYADLLDQIFHAGLSILFVYLTVSAVSDINIEVGGRFPVLEQASQDAANGTKYGALSGLLFLLGIFFFYRRKSGIFNAPMQEATESWKSVLKIFVLTVFPIMFAATVSNLREIIDTALFNALMPMKGYTADVIQTQRGLVSGKFVVLTNMPIAALGTLGIMLVPGIAAAITKQDHDSIQVHIETLMKMVFMVSIPAAIGESVLGVPIINWLFSSQPGGGELLRVGSFIIVFYSVSQNAAAILQGLGKLKICVRNAFYGLCVSTPILILCVMVFDIKAYALIVSLLTFSFTMAFFNIRSVIKYSGCRINMVKMFTAPLVCSLIMGGVAYLSYAGLYALLHSNTIAILTSIVLAIGVYFILLLNSSFYTREQILELPYGRIFMKFRFKD
ncbi:MAG: polysaccharide biosynthesis protein [Firmicutes bacterium]|nr:polysaccharide biosynthesis protein [Bacillota bacterium]